MRALFARMGLIAAVSSTLLTSTVQADGLLNWCNFDGCWEAGGAVIYQQACITNWPYAVNGPDLKSGDHVGVTTDGRFRARNLQPQWEWGFKIWGTWYSCDGCDFFSLTYKHLCTKTQKKGFFETGANSGRFVFVNHIGAIGSAADAFANDPKGTIVKAGALTEYDTIYLRGGRNLHCGCNSRFYAFLGGRWVGTEVRRQVTALLLTKTAPYKFNERTRFEGGGFEVGVGGEYGIGCGVNVVGALSTIALIGNRNDTSTTLWTTVPGGPAYNLSRKFGDRDITKCVPGVNFNIGINYTYDWNACGCCLRLVGEIGWEMDYYWNILALRSSSFGFDAADFVLGNADILGAEPDAVPVNFGNNGPYASLAIRF